MPELPEVETVKEQLKKRLIGRKIINIDIYYTDMIETPSVYEFEKRILNQTIIDMKRRGKWLMFELDNYYLLSHLRMEGKYFFKTKDDYIDKHEHVILTLDNKEQLRYRDTRKFGRMHLVEKDKAYDVVPLKDLGLEPWDELLTIEYLKERYKKKSIPIKTTLLEGFLIGAIIGSTDAASVFAILRAQKLNLKGSIASLLELESGSNDPIAYMITLIILTMLKISDGITLGIIIVIITKQIIFGLMIGGTIGVILMALIIGGKRGDEDA